MRQMKPLQISGRVLNSLMGLTSLTLRMNHKRLTVFSKDLKSFANDDDWGVSDECRGVLGNCLEGLKSLNSLELELSDMQMTPVNG